MINKLFEMISPSGTEDNIREFLANELSNHFNSAAVDNIGNLILHKEGNGERLCIECGMDSCGIMIVSTEPDKAFFASVGQLSPTYLADKKILMSNGECGIIRYKGEKLSEAKLSDLFLEINTENIKIGDFGIVCPDLLQTKDRYYANGLSDILPAAAVMSAIKAADINTDLTVIFSAQKVLGGRGLRAYFGVNSFDKVLTVNCCEGKIGSGCAIIVKDKSAVANASLCSELEGYSVKAQRVVSSENLYLGSIAHSGKGNDCTCVCIPVSYKGKALEGTDKNDFNAAVSLISNFINRGAKNE